LLLVDGELDLAGLDCLHDVAAQVECGELRVRVCSLDRVAGRNRDVRVERQHGRHVLVRLQLGLQLGGGRGDVVHALDLDVLDLTAEALLRTRAALLEPGVALLVHHAEELPARALGEPLARGLARHALVLADVRDRAERGRVALTRVQGDDGNSGVRGLLQRVTQRVGVRDRGGYAVHLLGHGRVDQLGVLLRVVGGLAVFHGHAHVLARLLRALLRHGPERVSLTVGDHGDR
jgi:hypothetical protein